MQGADLEESTADELHSLLKRLILTQVIKPKSRLSVSGIAKNLLDDEEVKNSLSEREVELLCERRDKRDGRTPVQNALARLQFEGLTRKANGSYAVVCLEADELAPVLSTRLLLESLVCYDLCLQYAGWNESRRTRLRQTLEKSLAVMPAVQSTPTLDRYAFVESDLDFHRQLIRFGKFRALEPELVRLFYATISQVQFGRLLDVQAKKIHDEHRSIADCICSTEPQAYETAKKMASHIRRAFATFFDVMEDDLERTLTEVRSVVGAALGENAPRTTPKSKPNQKRPSKRAAAPKPRIVVKSEKPKRQKPK